MENGDEVKRKRGDRGRAKLRFSTPKQIAKSLEKTAQMVLSGELAPEIAGKISYLAAIQLKALKDVEELDPKPMPFSRQPARRFIIQEPQGEVPPPPKPENGDGHNGTD